MLLRFPGGLRRTIVVVEGLAGPQVVLMLLQLVLQLVLQLMPQLVPQLVQLQSCSVHQQLPSPLRTCLASLGELWCFRSALLKLSAAP